MKGVSSITKNGRDYWYARVDGRKVYCGVDEKGHKLAVAARKKYDARKYETRQSDAAWKSKGLVLKMLPNFATGIWDCPPHRKRTGI